MKQLDKRQVIGWIAVAFSTIISCFLGILGHYRELS
jgi:hypothetical protein